VTTKVDGRLASLIVWMDAFLTNVDRTVKNTNMLMWHRELWLIDHGATLYFHHSWTNWETQALTPFPYIKEHVLLSFADQLVEVDAECKLLLNDDILREITELIPDDWANWKENGETPKDIKEIYFQFLSERLKHSENFLNEALNARKTII